MSSNLPSIDLTGAIVGTQKTLDFTVFVRVAPPGLPGQPQEQPSAHISIYNESGCRMIAVFRASGRSEFIPAGAWPVFDLLYNDASISFTVQYVLPNPPVSTINAVYYSPGENVPETPQLGNSPIRNRRLYHNNRSTDTFK